MPKIFVVFLMVLSIQCLQIQNLIQNQNFNTSKFWKNQADIPDFKLPDFFQTNTTGISFKFSKNGEYIREQGLLQSIFPNKGNSLKNYKGPLVVSFSHKIQNIYQDGKINLNSLFEAKVFMYVNIRYVNGIIFPIWVFANHSNHNQWKKQNVFIPSHGLIENVQVSVGACDFHINQQNSQVLITDVHLDRFDNENVNFKDLKLKYENLKFIQRLPQVYRTEISFFKSQLEFV
jgi:hypothetical protein